MYSVLTGSLLISLLHALIPNHWLPMLAIGRKEKWSLREITKVTLIAGLAHALSTILIGAFLGLLGRKLSESTRQFTHLFAPAVLVVLGIYFIYRHHRHKHFHLNQNLTSKSSKFKVIATLVIAMFFSPCMEIEAYFLLAGAQARWLPGVIALQYLVITVSGMLLLVNLAYKGLLRLNWHSLEHNAGIITGSTLVITGLLTFFIE